MQPSQANVRATAAVMIGDFVRAFRRSDVNLNDDQIRLVVEIERFDMLILQADIVIIVKVAGERGKPQWRKQRIFDRTPEWAFSFGERRQNHFEFHRGPPCVILLGDRGVRRITPSSVLYKLLCNTKLLSIK